MAIAREAGIDYDLKDINEIAKKTPYLSKIAPSSVYTMHDVQEAGGISAIINQLIKKGTIKGDRITVTGKTLKKMLLVLKSRTRKSFIRLKILFRQ